MSQFFPFDAYIICNETVISHLEKIREMENLDTFYAKFKNEMERGLKEKDIQINALQATNRELKEQLETKEKIIDTQARVR